MCHDSEEWCKIWRGIDLSKFEGKLICDSRHDMKNLAHFHRLKNSDFILESNSGTKLK